MGENGTEKLQVNPKSKTLLSRHTLSTYDILINVLIHYVLIKVIGVNEVLFEWYL